MGNHHSKVQHDLCCHMIKGDKSPSCMADFLLYAAAKKSEV